MTTDEPGPDEQLNDPGAARESAERERSTPTDGMTVIEVAHA